MPGDDKVRYIEERSQRRSEPLSAILCRMSFSTGDVSSIIPADEVPDWVDNSRTATYLNVVLSTIVVYDACKSSHSAQMVAFNSAKCAHSNRRYVHQSIREFLYLFWTGQILLGERAALLHSLQL